MKHNSTKGYSTILFSVLVILTDSDKPFYFERGLFFRIAQQKNGLLFIKWAQDHTVVVILFHSRYITALCYFIEALVVYLLREARTRYRNEESASEEEVEWLHGE